MKRLFLAMFAGSLGAGLMYFTDPIRGHARRALLRDRLYSKSGDVQELLQKGSRDLLNRSRGLLARALHLVQWSVVPDSILVERVRTRLGRAITHPHAIHVIAQDGLVLLHGPILRHEVDHLLNRIRSVPGVRDIRLQLNIYDSSENIPPLQGGKPLPATRWEFEPWHYSPGVRMVTGVGGVFLTLFGLRQHRLVGGIVLPLGVCMTVWGFSDPNAHAQQGREVRRPGKPQTMEPKASEEPSGHTMEEQITGAISTTPSI